MTQPIPTLTDSQTYRSHPRSETEAKHFHAFTIAFPFAHVIRTGARDWSEDKDILIHFNVYQMDQSCNEQRHKINEQNTVYNCYT